MRRCDVTEALRRRPHSCRGRHSCNCKFGKDSGKGRIKRANPGRARGRNQVEHDLDDQDIEAKTSKRELLWAKAKEKDTAAWQDPVRGHHLERIHPIVHSEVLLLHTTPIIISISFQGDNIVLPAELEDELVRTIFATSVFYDFTHVF